VRQCRVGPWGCGRERQADGSAPTEQRLLIARCLGKACRVASGLWLSVEALSQLAQSGDDVAFTESVDFVEDGFD
jgi:hypothetical protein